MRDKDKLDGKWLSQSLEYEVLGLQGLWDGTEEVSLQLDFNYEEGYNDDYPVCGFDHPSGFYVSFLSLREGDVKLVDDHTLLIKGEKYRLQDWADGGKIVNITELLSKQNY